MNSKKIGDLHVRKESHVGIPADKVEWHLKAGDLNMKCKPGTNYTLCVSVVCTSSDDEGTRFRQLAKPYIEKGTAFDNDYKTDGGVS